MVHTPVERYTWPGLIVLLAPTLKQPRKQKTTLLPALPPVQPTGPINNAVTIPKANVKQDLPIPFGHFKCYQYACRVSLNVARPFFIDSCCLTTENISHALAHFVNHEPGNVLSTADMAAHDSKIPKFSHPQCISRLLDQPTVLPLPKKASFFQKMPLASPSATSPPLTSATCMFAFRFSLEIAPRRTRFVILALLPAPKRPHLHQMGRNLPLAVHTL